MVGAQLGGCCLGSPQVTTDKWQLVVESSEGPTRLDVQDGAFKQLVIDPGCCLGAQLGLNAYTCLFHVAYQGVSAFQEEVF